MHKANKICTHALYYTSLHIFCYVQCISACYYEYLVDIKPRCTCLTQLQKVTSCPNFGGLKSVAATSNSWASNSRNSFDAEQDNTTTTDLIQSNANCYYIKGCRFDHICVHKFRTGCVFYLKNQQLLQYNSNRHCQRDNYRSSLLATC